MQFDWKHNILLNQFNFQIAYSNGQGSWCESNNVKNVIFENELHNFKTTHGCAVLMSFNKSETAVHCCHFLGTQAAHA